MMSSPAPSVASTKETTNYARLCRLLVDVGSQALRDTFDRIHPPPGLHLVLASGTPAHSTLQLLRKKNILNPSQWAKLNPAVSSSVSSASFDITLLVVLLRNICNLIPPVTGWDKLPSDADTTIGANIARVKYYRNTVYGHATQASVDDVTFNNQWVDIKSALIALGGANYSPAIDKLRNESMDPDIEEYYKELLKQWVNYEDSIKEQLEKMEETIRNDLQQMRSEIGNIADTLTQLTALMAQREAKDDDRSDLEEMKREIQTVREKLNEVSTKDQVEELKGALATLTSRLPPVERKPSMEDVFDGIHQRYKLREGWPAPFPWCEEFHSHLDDVCTKLKVVNRKNPNVPATDNTVNLSGIFKEEKEEEECPQPRRVLIQGTPGVGEKLFCQKLVYDWATGRQREQCIARFDKVLMLRCRDMKSDLWETIDDQLLPREFGTDVRETFVDFVCQNQSHVLLVLDGLDETPTDKLPNLLEIVQGVVLPECNLLATGRHKPEIKKATEYFDTLLEIEGFTEEVAEEIICEFLTEDLAQKSLSNLRVNENLKNMCPENKTELYVEIIRCVLRRSRRLKGLPGTSKDLIQEENKTLLKHLGQIALNGLRKDTLDFERSELGSHADDFFFSFQSEGSEQRRHQCYSFLHKSFQQWFAAFNLYCQLIRKEISPDSLITGRYAQQLDEVLPFTCGLLAARCEERAIALIKSITKQVKTKTTDAQLLPFSRKRLVPRNTKTTYAQPSGPLLKSELVRDTKKTEAQTSGASCKPFAMQKPPNKNDQDAIGLVLLALECIKQSRADLARELGLSLNLQTLSLQNQKLSVASVIVLANSLKYNTTVTELNLSGNNIGDAGAEGLADMLTSNKTLTKLNLPQNAIGEAGASQPAAGLEKCNTTRTELDLTNNNIGDGGATCLADALRSNKTLTELNLSHNNIGDKGASSLASVLKQYNNVLEVLNLSSNNVREAGAIRLADALRDNKNLSQLSLHGNNDIGEDAYGRLSNLHPGGRVILPSPGEMVL